MAGKLLVGGFQKIFMTPPKLPELSQRKIFQAWWPLAASWLLMGFELPILSAVVARLADPKIHLAAYGGIVFPLALLIESPIIMLLAASTALSKDWASYQKMNRFMMLAGFVLSVLHILIAFTPLYDWIVVPLFSPPPEIIEPARIGLMIMTPWTWAIAYRRFHQGVLIRFGKSRAVSVGTATRLVALVAVLVIGYLINDLPGIVVGTSAIAVAVIVEALYVGWRVYPLMGQLKQAKPIVPALTYPAFFKFYTPLVMTSLLGLLAMPLGTAAIARMPDALNSLAVWPVVSGFLFMLLSTGIAYNEVVVSLLDEPNSVRPLRRFAIRLSLCTTGVTLLVTATPLSTLWFQAISGLTPTLAQLAQASMWLALLRPFVETFKSWYQGVVIHSKNTRSITEAVVIFLVATGAVLIAGIAWGQVAGIYVGQIAFLIGYLAQTAWMWWRSQPALAALYKSNSPPISDSTSVETA